MNDKQKLIQLDNRIKLLEKQIILLVKITKLLTIKEN